MGANDKRDLANAGGRRSPVDAFLDAYGSLAPRRANDADGRMIFALDATMSRQPTWDLAQRLQRRMFEVTERLGVLSIQLMYFRGFGECKASHFVDGGNGLAALMEKIGCRGGQTQIGKVLRHAAEENRARRVHALVFIGDAAEEPLDELCVAAGELGLVGLKAFMFHEGCDRRAGTAFREIARLTGGAYGAFDCRAPERLSDLLAAAARYAAGGVEALIAAANEKNAIARQLLLQITR